ncbi:collagenase [Thalassotalea ganghwensis]
MKPQFLLKAAVVAVSLATLGCSQTPSSNSVNKQLSIAPQSAATLQVGSVTDVLAAESEQLWTTSFDHYQPGRLKAVANAITYLASSEQINDQRLERLSFYLRVFSSFGPIGDWQEGSAEALNNALLAIQSMPEFKQVTPASARIHENYAVALYRLYFLEPLQPLVVEHIESLAGLIDLYAEAELSQDLAVDYALWEVLRAAAVLPYEARRKNKDVFIDGVQHKQLLEKSLLNFITATNAMRKESEWPRNNASWALANHYNLYNQQYWNAYYKHSKEEQKLLQDDKMSLPQEQSMKQLDDALWQALSADSSKSLAELQEQYSVPYLVTSFRSKSSCQEDELKGRCISPTIEEALPIKHVCSDTLYILTQEMTKQQLNDSCSKLIAQEDTFHEKLKTNREPVANDFNDKLRVVIFDDHAQYNKYGQLTFDIHTDNGGMYIEGTTQNPDNIATFYSFEHFWIRPEFGVWNLNHEYVHYLDGRFVKYDTFNHFPSNMVWWSEGLAEYISKAEDNPRAFKTAKKLEKEKWPSLMDVFNTEYKDGADRVYQWGYLAVRFMYEHYPEQYRQLAHFLKTDYFDGYKKLLEQLGEAHGDEFTAWLESHIANLDKSEEAEDERKPRQFYRYTYKNYLKPDYLVEDSLHMHWQYWHANALKNK